MVVKSGGGVAAHMKRHRPADNELVALLNSAPLIGRHEFEGRGRRQDHRRPIKMSRADRAHDEVASMAASPERARSGVTCIESMRNDAS